MNMHVNPVMQSALAPFTHQRYEVKCKYKIINQTIEVSAISEHSAMQSAKVIFSRMNPPIKRDEVKVVSCRAL